jgi:hypothetical protein
MTRAFHVSLALVAAAAPASAEIPAAGIYVATQTRFGSTGIDEHFYIHLIKPTGIEKVLDTTSEVEADFGWSDGHTLWRSMPGKDVAVGKYVDGKLVDTIKVMPADWKAGITSYDAGESPELLITGKGEVWLSLCHKRKDANIGRGACTKASYARVDVKPIAIATSKPSGVDAYRVQTIFQGGKPLAFPRAAAPAGYAVKLQPVKVTKSADSGQNGRTMKGAVCTGAAKQTVSWPDASDDLDFTMVPKTVTWLRASPPLVQIAGKATNPIGMVEDHEAYLFDCKERVQEAEFFGGDVWGVLRGLDVDTQKQKHPASDGTWSIYGGDKLVGTLPGWQIRLAPH